MNLNIAITRRIISAIIISIVTWILICRKVTAESPILLHVTSTIDDTSYLVRAKTISESDFNFQINRFVGIMKKRRALQTTDYIILVRLVNTVLLAPRHQDKEAAYFKKDIYVDFLGLFHDYYWEQAVKKLEAIRRKGGEGDYSFKYNVGIVSMPPHDIESDYYHIIFN